MGDQPPTSPLDAAMWRYLADHRVARLATVDPAGSPTVTPICYAIAAGRVYVALDAKPKRVAPTALKRVRNLLANPRVCLVVDDYADDWRQLSHLIVWSWADLLAVDDPDHPAAVAQLRERYPQYVAMPIEAQPIIRLRPTRAKFWRFTE